MFINAGNHAYKRLCRKTGEEGRLCHKSGEEGKHKEGGGDWGMRGEQEGRREIVKWQ